jgi:hypothetical protein
MRPWTPLLAALSLLALTPAGASALPAIAINPAGAAQTVVVFDTATPGTLTSGPTTITGLAADDAIVDADFRPATAGLYVVTRNSGTGAGRVYTLNPLTGEAAAVSATSFGALSGTRFGIDFNPVADRLRVISDADQNLRLDPNTGGLVGTDGTLAFAAGDTNSGENPNEGAVAYSNNTPGAATTTLYGLEFSNEVLTTHNPPNDGTLNTVGLLLLSDAISLAGFDISETGGLGFISVTSSALPNTSYLYSIDLETGNSSSVGPIGGTTRRPHLALAPAARFGVNDMSVAESAGAVTLTVDRTIALGATSVNYEAVSGTATKGEDFSATTGTIAFAQGQRTATVAIPITEDLADEGKTNETFRLVLSVPGANGRIADLDGTVAIVDNDAPMPAPVPPEDKPPTVKLTAPASLSAFTPVTLTAEATDDLKVDRVVFLRGARALATDTAAPFTAPYSPAAGDIGTSSLIAIAFDSSGQSATSVVDVAVGRVKPVLTAATTPKRDARDPRAFTTAGAIGLPAGADKKAACAGGRVNVRFQAGKTTISSRTATVAADCTFRSRVSFKLLHRFATRKTLSVKVAFQGTPVVDAATSSGSVTVR